MVIFVKLSPSTLGREFTVTSTSCYIAMFSWETLAPGSFLTSTTCQLTVSLTVLTSVSWMLQTGTPQNRPGLQVPKIAVGSSISGRCQNKSNTWSSLATRRTQEAEVNNRNGAESWFAAVFGWAACQQTSPVNATTQALHWSSLGTVRRWSMCSPHMGVLSLLWLISVYIFTSCQNTNMSSEPVLQPPAILHMTSLNSWALNGFSRMCFYFPPADIRADISKIWEISELHGNSYSCCSVRYHLEALSFFQTLPGDFKVIPHAVCT